MNFLDNMWIFLHNIWKYPVQHMSITCKNIYKKYTTPDQLLNNISYIS